MTPDELIKCSDKAANIFALIESPWFGHDDFRLILTGGETIAQRRRDTKCHYPGVRGPYWI